MILSEQNSTKIARRNKQHRCFVINFFLVFALLLQNFLFLVNPVFAAPIQDNTAGTWSDAFSDTDGISSSNEASRMALPSASSLDNSTRLNEYLQFAFRANDVLQDEFTDYFTTTTQAWNSPGSYSTEGLGMLISTYVALYNKNPSWLSSSDRQAVLNRAVASANKLLTHQFSMSDPDVNKRGGFEIHPYTSIDDQIYVWGTAPDVTALVSLYLATNDETYKTAAVNGAEWLLAAEDPSVPGKYRNHYDYTAQAWAGTNEMDSAAAGALFQVYSITNDSRYNTNAIEAADKLVETGTNSTWWDNNSHYSLYAARDGLLESYRYTGNTTYLDKVIEYEATLSTNFSQNYEDAQAMRMEYELYEFTHKKSYITKGNVYAEDLWNVTYTEPSSVGRYNVAQHDSDLTYLSGTIPIWILEAQATKSIFDTAPVTLTDITNPSSTNFALSSNGTTIATEYTVIPGGATNLIDGNYATKDYVAGSTNTYKTIKLTFSQINSITQIKLYLHAVSEFHRNYTYWIESSTDDSSYTTIVSETNKGDIGTDTWYTENFSSTNAKYIIIHMKSALYIPGVWEIEVYQNVSATERSLTSTTITPQTISNWTQLAWSDDEPINTDIKYQIKYQSGGSWVLVPDLTLSGNSTGFDTSPISLSGLTGSSYPSLRLVANLSTTYSSASPAINSWQISWNPDTTGPTGTISNGNGSPTNDTTPTFNLTIADAGVGITGAQMQFSCDNATWSTWESYATPKTDFNIRTGAGCTDVDGSKTIYVEYKDSLGNIGSSYNTGAFTLDTVSSNAALSGTPASITNSASASITVAGTDITAYKYKIDSGAYGAEIPIATLISLSSLSDASHTLSVIGKDSAGNWQAEGSATTYTWTVDTTAPAVTFTIPATSDSLTITFTSFSATDANTIIGYLVNETATTPAIDDIGWAGTAQTQYVFTTEGAKTLYAWAKDEAGNISTSGSGAVTVTLPAPAVSHSGGGGCYGCYVNPSIPSGGFKMSINGGASTTPNRNVFLGFNAGADIKKMAISMTGDFTDASQENYIASKQWDLCSKLGGAVKNPTYPDGKYTVYTKFYTAYGRSSDTSIASSTITLKSSTTSVENLQQYTNLPFTNPFTKYLQYRQTNADIKRLQIFLNSDPDTRVANSGAGSPGKETNYFGILTYKAVIKFQEKYAKDILAPWGFVKGTGYVGKTTLAKINELMGNK
jgi:hypothetical protein